MSCPVVGEAGREGHSDTSGDVLSWSVVSHPPKDLPSRAGVVVLGLPLPKYVPLMHRSPDDMALFPSFCH